MSIDVAISRLRGHQGWAITTPPYCLNCKRPPISPFGVGQTIRLLATSLGMCFHSVKPCRYCGGNAYCQRLDDYTPEPKPLPPAPVPELGRTPPGGGSPVAKAA
jgi:hypothetical protein